MYSTDNNFLERPVSTGTWGSYPRLGGKASVGELMMSAVDPELGNDVT